MAAQVGIIYAKAQVDINEALKRLDQFEGRLKQIEGRTFGPNVQPAVRGLQNLGKAAGKVWDTYDGLTKGIQRFGDGLVHQGQILATWSYRMMLATAPLAAAGVASFKMAQDLETSMAMVATQLKLRGPELDEFIDRITKGIVDLSTEIPLATKDIADALYYLVSSMTIDPEIATKFLEPISKAAVAGKSTAQQVAEAITPILNVYQDLARDTEGVEHVLDVLFETVRRGRGEFADIAVQVGDFVQIAEQAGATFEEAMAAFAMATRVTTPSQAATWIANLYRSLFTPRSVEALQDLGIAVEQVVDGTGRWVTKNRELAESERERVEALRETIRAMRERIGFAGAKLGIGEEIWTRIQTYVETGELLPGVTQSLANAYRRMGEAQGELNELLARGAESYQSWTGELERRETLDIITDLAEKISVLKSEQEKLNIIYEVFPRMRGMQGAVLFIENLAEITEWSKEFTEATGLTNEAFGIMMETFESKIGVLKNMFLAVGFDLLDEYADDIKNLIGGITELFGAFRELPADTKAKAGAIAGMLVAAGPIALGGSVVLMGIGALINLFGALISLPSLAMLTAVGALFGDKIPVFLEGLQAYGGGLQGFVTSIADLAVHFGLISESDAIGILEGLGITVDKLDSEKVDRIAEGIEGIADAVSRGWEDLQEWQQAFGLFLDDVQNREGIVGTLVGYIERLVTSFRDIVLPEGEYVEWGPKEKARIIDLFIGGLAISKIAAKVLNVAAGVVNILGTGGLVKLLFGGGGAAAAGAAGRGATEGATAGQSWLGWLLGPFTKGPLAALALGLLQTGARPTLETEIKAGLQLLQDYRAELGLIEQAYADGKITFEEYTTQAGILNEKIEKTRELVTHYGYIPPETRGSVQDIDTMIRGMKEAWDVGFAQPLDTSQTKAFNFLDELERKLDGVAGDRESTLEVFTPLEVGERVLFDTALNRWLNKIDELTKDRTQTIKVDYVWSKLAEQEFHLGGYTMHEGGYPPLGMPNVLASEFVMSPYTTHVLENYLGRLDQRKLRQVAQQRSGDIYVNFYKGSVTSRKDAEEAAEIILDKITDRAHALAYMER